LARSAAPSVVDVNDAVERLGPARGRRRDHAAAGIAVLLVSFMTNSTSTWPVNTSPSRVTPVEPAPRVSVSSSSAISAGSLPPSCARASATNLP
jgi:hypothetical protein